MKKTGIIFLVLLFLLTSVSSFADEAGTAVGGGVIADGTVFEEEEGSYFSDGTFDYEVDDGSAIVRGLTFKNNPDDYGNGIYTIPSTVRGYPVIAITDYAFAYERHIVEITVPHSVKCIYSGAFSGCANLVKLTVSYETEVWGTPVVNYSSDFVLCGYRYSPIYQYAVKFNIPFQSLGDMPRVVKASGTAGAAIDWTLDNYGRLTLKGTGAMEDYFPNDDAPWDDYDKDIVEVVIEEGITSLGTYAFDNMKNLEAVTVPSSVKVIEEGAFRSAGKLASVTLSEGLEYIAANALPLLMGSEIELPSTIKEMARDAISSDITIKGAKYSYAESYAQSIGAEFVATSEMELNEVYVTTTDELIAAIASNTVITMADGLYILNKTTEVTSDGRTYLLDRILLHDIINLTIKAQNPGKVEILAMQNEYHPLVDTAIFQIQNCDNIVFDGIRMGNRAIKNSYYGEVKKDEIQLFGGLSDYCEHYGICVVNRQSPNAVYKDYDFLSLPNDVTVKNCDIFNCTYAVYYSAEGVGTLTIEDSVLRDNICAALRMYHGYGLKLNNCIISGNGCAEAYKANWCIYADVTESEFTNNLVLNNSNIYYYYSTAEEKVEADNTDINNLWNQSSPLAYGVCQNGVVWQVVKENNENVLKLGYDVTKEGKTIQSTKSTIYPYSAYSEPWSQFEIARVDCAGEVETVSVLLGVFAEKDDYGTITVEVFRSMPNDCAVVVAGFGVEEGLAVTELSPNQDGKYYIYEDTAQIEAIKVFVWESIETMRPLGEAKGTKV